MGIHTQHDARTELVEGGGDVFLRVVVLQRKEGLLSVSPVGNGVGGAVSSRAHHVPVALRDTPTARVC